MTFLSFSSYDTTTLIDVIGTSSNYKHYPQLISSADKVALIQFWSQEKLVEFIDIQKPEQTNTSAVQVVLVSTVHMKPNKLFA